MKGSPFFIVPPSFSLSDLLSPPLITLWRGHSKHCALVIKANFHHSFSPPVTSSSARERMDFNGQQLISATLTTSQVVWTSVENE